MNEPSAVSNDRLRAVELLISNVLRAGVVTSLVVIIFGTVVSFIHHPEYIASRPSLAHITRPGAAFPRTIDEVVAGVQQLHGQAFVTVGLLILIATPVMRVAVSIFAFAYERDWTFVLITTVVLALLLLSFALGRGEP